MGGDVFTQGDLIIITGGEYSSYGVESLARALKSFTRDEAMATPGCVRPEGSARHFSLPGLIAAGFIEELPPFREIWTG